MFYVFAYSFSLWVIRLSTQVSLHMYELSLNVVMFWQTCFIYLTFPFSLFLGRKLVKPFCAFFDNNGRLLTHESFVMVNIKFKCLIKFMNEGKLKEKLYVTKIKFLVIVIIMLYYH